MQAIGFRHFYHGIYYHARICSILTVTEQPVLAPQGNRPDAIFRRIIAEAAASVFEISHQHVFSISDISHCPIHAAPFFWPLRIKPAQEALNYWFFILQAAFVYLCIRQFLCLIASFIFKQLIAVQDSLNCRMTVVFVMTTWYGFNQISPDVCITAAPTELLQLVVTAVAIHHDIGVFCQVLFPEKSVRIPCFHPRNFPAFGGHFQASRRMSACSIR